jgi:hypothetical protein
MKTLLKIIFTLFILQFTVCISVFSQNLVPNPSFEDTVACPCFNSSLHLANGWIVNINSVDYFNSCCKDTLQVSVPKNAWGYQCPANGKAYAGFYANCPKNPNANEFLGTLLVTPLTIGQKYYVSLKVSLADAFVINCGIDKIGALFTNVNYDSVIVLSPNNLIANASHIYSSQIITDTVNWTIIRGSFTADSAYQFILFGHFFDSSNTNFNCFNSNPKWSYYFIDDVCVSMDSLTCEIPNGPNVCDSTINVLETNRTKEKITIYPNPTSNKILIDLPHSQKATIKFYNLFGLLLFDNTFSEKNITVDLSSLPDGIYLIQVQQNNKFFNKIITLIK